MRGDDLAPITNTVLLAEAQKEQEQAQATEDQGKIKH
jgi:hypothetical protein